jgi:hypothetical protein
MPTDAENVRFVLGATGDNASLLTDTEIEHAIVLYPLSWRLAAAALAERLAALATQKRQPVSFSAAGEMSVSWADDAAKWQSIAKRLKEEHAQAIAYEAAPVGMQVHSMAYKADPEQPEFTVNRTRYGGLKR